MKSLDNAILYEGILWRRFTAAVLDYLFVLGIGAIFWILSLITAVLTWGYFLIPFIVLSVPVLDIFYTGALLGGKKQSTWAQRIFGLKAVDSEGLPPGYPRAFLFILLYYLLIVPTTNLLELIALIDGRRRTLPDLLAGMIFIRNRDDLFR